MAALTGALWRVVPGCSFAPIVRRCSGCHSDRPFECSEKFRLNANGRRLDAWLIYRCAVCAERWNAPVFRRRPVDTVEPATLAGLEHSDPDLARRMAATMAIPTAFELERLGDPDAPTIVLEIPHPLAARLDRVLAVGFERSRSAVVADARLGSIVIAGGLRLLRKPARDGQRVLVLSRA